MDMNKLDKMIPVTIQEMLSKGWGMHNLTTPKHLVIIDNCFSFRRVL